MAIDKTELLASLEKLLDSGSFKDYSNNGLQVDSHSTAIRKICTGVDASLPFFMEAKKRGADMVVCHHGISWGDSLKRITGENYRLVSFLIENNMALWAAHIPLDAHPVLGNNALLADALGLGERKPFGIYYGHAIGFCGNLPSPLGREEFASLLRRTISPRVTEHPFGKETISSVAVISGGGADSVLEAAEKGIDAFVTGETNLASYNRALHAEQNMYALGHYATEVFGVRALGEWIAENFSVEHEFIDLGIDL